MSSLPYLPTPEAQAEVRAQARAAALGEPGPVSVIPAGGPPWAWRTFDDELVLLVLEEPARAQLWTEELREVLLDAARNIVARAPDKDERKAAEQAIRDWSSAVDPLAIWSGGSGTDGWSYRMYSGKYGRAARLLLRLDASVAGAALETSPHPGMLEMAFHDARHSDLIALLKDAPKVLMADGVWIDRRIVALATLRQLEHHLRHDADGLDTAVRCAPTEGKQEAELAHRRDWHQKELPRRAKEVAHALLEREDGVALAVAFGGVLARGLRAGPAGTTPLPGETDADAVPRTVEVLFDAMAAGLTSAAPETVLQLTERWINHTDTVAAAAHAGAIPLRREVEPNQLADDEGEGSRLVRGNCMDTIVFAAEVLVRPGVADVTLSRLWAMVSDRLVARDPSVGQLLQYRNESRADARLAAVLARLGDPDGALSAAYRRLEPQRRRARFGARYEGSDDLESSVVLLRIGLWTFAHERDMGLPASGGLSRFDFIVRQARRLWLTAWLDVGEHLESLVLSCFCFLASFPHDARSSRAGEMLSPLRSRADLVLRALGSLAMNGVPREEIHAEAAMAGHDIDALRRRTEELVAHAFVDFRFVETLAEALEQIGAELPVSWIDPASGFGDTPRRRPRSRVRPRKVGRADS